MRQVPRLGRVGRTATIMAGVLAGMPAIATEMPANNIAVGQSADQWSAAFSSQAQYYAWSSTRGYPAGNTTGDGSGSQLYIPIALQLTGQPSDVLSFQFMVRSGYIRSRQSSGGTTGETRGTTDTSLSTSVAYTGWSSVQPFLSLSTNLPTGDSKLSGGANQAHMDADVVAAPTFGEGFNGGATAGANIPLSDSLIASIGTGYTYRGSYTTSNLGDLDPGDTYSFNIGIGYQGDNLTAQAQLSYTGETETTRNGEPYYQSGGSIASVVGLSYAWDEAIASRTNLSYSHYEKNRVEIGGLPPLVDEAFNSNSDVFQIDIDTTYSGANFSIGPTLGFLYRDRNAWSPTELQFLPAKKRWSVGLAGQYALTQTVALSAQVSRIWVDQNESPDKTFLGPGSGVPEINTDAWLATAGLSWQF